MTFSGLLILEVADMFDRWISRWIRADAAALLVLTLWAVTATHGSWMWFFVLFLLPDLSMVGYVFGPRVGAASYNVGHLCAWPSRSARRGTRVAWLIRDDGGAELDRAYRLR